MIKAILTGYLMAIALMFTCLLMQQPVVQEVEESPMVWVNMPGGSYVQLHKDTEFLSFNYMNYEIPCYQVKLRTPAGFESLLVFYTEVEYLSFISCFDPRGAR